MTRLLNNVAIHRMILLIAIAIALGITLHPVFLVVVQMLALAACAYIMWAVIKGRNARLVIR